MVRARSLSAAVLPIILIILPFLLPAFLDPAGAAAQEKDDEQTFYESVDVQVVNLEVFVTDKSGQRVTGLTRDDFQVLEDGKPVEISNFFAVGDAGPASGPAATPSAVAPETSPPPAATLPDEQHLHLAIVVDNLSIIPQARIRLLEALRKEVIPRLRPEDLALVATYEGSSVNLVQGLTSDKSALLAALDAVAQGAPRGVERSMDRRQLLSQIDRADRMEGQQPGHGADMAAEDAQEVYAAIRSYVQQRYNETRGTLDALTGFTDALAGLPGRKSLLYVGGGLSLRPGESFFQAWQSKFAQLSNSVGASDFDGFEHDLTRFFEQLVQHANSNRVTFYTLGATEELAGISAEFGGSSTWTTQLATTEEMNLTESMRRLGDGTGGLASVNAINPGPILARMLDDFNAYYSLGFVPQGKPDGKNRKLQVTVRGRRDLLVRHRDGRRERPSRERMTDRTLAALLLDPGSNPLEMAVDFVRETKNAKGQLEVEALVKFPIGRLVLLPQGKFHEGRVSVWVSSRDLRGRSSAVQEIIIPIRVPNDQLLTALGQTAAYKMPLLLRPEEHRIAVAMRDELGNVDSAVTVSFKPGQTEPPAAPITPPATPPATQ
jgi:VWFA-related protein